MSDIALITDSTANIPEELIKQYGIEVVPQVLVWEGETLLDEVDIQPDEFYERLVQADQLPTTSQAAIASFKKLFEPHVKKGTPILAILISSNLSGTVGSARQAKAMFPDARIEIVDSYTVAMALGFQVLAAARAAEKGSSMDEIIDIVHHIQENIGLFFVVDTLEFLHKGGRIGGAARFVGTALRIKPLLEISDGKVEPLEQVRTKSKAQARLVDLIEERVAGKERVRIAAMHAAAPEDAQNILEVASDRIQPEEQVLTVVGPVLGTHTGPGTVGMAYCTGF